MTETKHTPGPWAAERGHQSDRIYGIRGITRWNFLLKGASAQSQANALVMLAAPDMLAALRTVGSALAEHKITQKDDGLWAAFSQVIAAIAKAEGSA